jgi:hypothetical protein
MDENKSQEIVLNTEYSKLKSLLKNFKAKLKQLKI